MATPFWSFPTRYVYNAFPLQTNAHILQQVLHEVAIALPTDKDLIQLSLSCKELMARILAPESGVWRGRFQGRYNVPAKKANNELMFEYITRAIVLKAKIDFKEEEDDRQRLWMRVLRTMVQESLTLPFHSLLPKTLKCIGDVLQKTNFLAEPLKPGKRSELFYALQLVSAHNNRDETHND